MIENEKVDFFYVGNHGVFDSIVVSVLQSLKEKYPHIDYVIVLAYLPKEADDYTNYSYTIFPEEIELVQYRFAICKRNEWMIKQADVVVTYVCHDFGGAAKYKDMAFRKGKRIINISDIK